jgi:hypothetical protein
VLSHGRHITIYVYAHRRGVITSEHRSSEHPEAGAPWGGAKEMQWSQTLVLRFGNVCRPVQFVMNLTWPTAVTLELGPESPDC